MKALSVMQPQSAKMFNRLWQTTLSLILGGLLTASLIYFAITGAMNYQLTQSSSVSMSQVNQAVSSVAYLPVVFQSPPTVVPTGGEWSQHAHDAQRTSYSDQAMPTPWRWKWVWNGSTSTGGIVSGKFGLPRNSQPVTGGGRVYIAAGSRGVYALSESNGVVIWNRNPGGSINSTPAYDGDTNSLFVVSSNGILYKLNASTGNTVAQFSSGSASTLPLPPAIYSDRVFFSMGNRVYAISKANMAQIWSYDAGNAVHTPPAYSPSKNLVIAVSSDLFVHAINNANGGQAWRVKPTVRTGGNPGDGNTSLAEVSYGWPVIAEGHGYVLVKFRLDWQALWVWNPWPSTNSAMRSNLTSRPEYQALAVLNLQNGSQPFIANVGHGGYGDGGVLPMGPQPVVKRFANGQEVAYVVMRGSPCINNPCDGRYDSHLGELLLDGTTVSGYQAGYVRFIRTTNIPTDEQVNLSMAGDNLLGGHWEAGIGQRILDRSPSRGAGSNPITTSDLPHIATSQDSDVCGTGFVASHYCGQALSNTRWWPAGFYNFWKQGSVYDRYWSGYAAWIVSNGSLYYVSTDGSVIALQPGNPGSSLSNPEPLPGDAVFSRLNFSETIPADSSVVSWEDLREDPIPFTEARNFAGQVKIVEGEIQFIFNNGKAVYLGFQNPHQGAFKIRILKEDWGAFSAAPEELYTIGQKIRVIGFITWYQGDPVIYVSEPSQIK